MKKKKSDIGRYSSKNKMSIVLEVLKGKSLDEASREHKIPASTISQWREQFLTSGQNGLKAQVPDSRDDEIRRLKQKLGDLLFQTDALITVNNAYKQKVGNPF